MQAHPCEPIPDLGWYDTAPQRFDFEVTLDCTPARLFEVFEDAVAWTVWAPGLTKVVWTSPQPYGVGTTRTVYLRGGPVCDELFLAWEPGRETAFCFTSTSEAVWRSFGERYRVEALPDGRCRLVWTVAYDPIGYFRVLHPWVRPMMRLALGTFMRRLARYVRRPVTEA